MYSKPCRGCAKRSGLGLLLIDPVSEATYGGAAEPYAEPPAPVELTLEYDPEPERTGYERLRWGVPAWLLLAGGAYVAARSVGLRI